MTSLWWKNFYERFPAASLSKTGYCVRNSMTSKQVSSCSGFTNIQIFRYKFQYKSISRSCTSQRFFLARFKQRVLSLSHSGTSLHKIFFVSIVVEHREAFGRVDFTLLVSSRKKIFFYLSPLQLNGQSGDRDFSTEENFIHRLS